MQKHFGKDLRSCAKHCKSLDWLTTLITLDLPTCSVIKKLGIDLGQELSVVSAPQN